MSAEKKDSYKKDDVAGEPRIPHHTDYVRVHSDGHVDVSCPVFGDIKLPPDLSKKVADKINEIVNETKSDKPAMVTSPAFRERYDQINWGGGKSGGNLN